MGFTIRLAKADEAEEIFQLMEYVHSNMEDKTLYVNDTLEYVKEHINKRGFAVIAQDNRSKITAFFIVRIPLEDEDNLGCHLNLDKNDCLKVAHMESAAVLPDSRGYGLQKKMLDFAEKELEGQGYKYYMATISPKNTPSLSTFLKSGYKIVETTEKYGDLERHILLKEV